MGVIAPPSHVGYLRSGAGKRTAIDGPLRQTVAYQRARRRILPFASRRSVFGADGEAHRAARGRIEPALAPEAMEERSDQMIRIAQEHLGRWPRRATDAAHPWESAGLAATQAGRADGADADALFQRRRRPVAEPLGRALEERRADPEGMDILGCMVRAEPHLEPPEIVDELMSTLMAAQEPPSLGLSWILDRLSRHPGAAEQFLEAPDGEQPGDAAVKETLRLHPPASGVLRRLKEPMRLGE